MSGDLASEMLHALELAVELAQGSDPEALYALQRQLDRVEQAMADATVALLWQPPLTQEELEAAAFEAAA